MNRTDRLLAIILELQRHTLQRAEDLAATFETSKRTIYRDIEALAEAGVPVVSVPGQGFSLIEGFFLPPVSFSKDEAMMLLLGADVMADNFDEHYGRSALNAAAKIEGVLPPQLRESVRRLKHSFRFVSNTSDGAPAVLERLKLLRRAIMELRTVQFRYHARFADSEQRDHAGSPRLADPYALVNYDHAWYLNAHDHRHGDVRRFRLERMEGLSLTDRSFAAPDTQDSDHAASRDDPRPVEIRARFAPQAARWVREDHNYFLVTQETLPDGGLLATYRVRHEDELLQYLLQWGANVQVETPEGVRTRMAQAAEAILAAHKTLLT